MGQISCLPKKRSKLKEAPRQQEKTLQGNIDLVWPKFSIYSVFIQVFDKIRQSFLDKLRKSLKMSVNEIDFGIKFLLVEYHVAAHLLHLDYFFDIISCFDILYCRCTYYWYSDSVPKIHCVPTAVGVLPCRPQCPCYPPLPPW